jgi:recombination protein RecA
MSQIERQFGKGAIMRLGSDGRVADVPVIPTGSLSLDVALGLGGVPRGRVVEIFGPESSGKTTLALHIVAEAQKRGGIASFVDAEHGLWRSPKSWCAVVPWMRWSLTRWPP